jgi:type I restriction enzyme S subunit
MAVKETDLGQLPHDWNLYLLGDITDPNRPISYGIVQTGKPVTNGIQCLRVIDLENGKILRQDLITTSKSISDAYKRTILRPGDLVTPLRGKVGEVAIIDESLQGANITRGLALIALKDEYSARLLRQALSSKKVRYRLQQSMNGSALQEIPIATLRNFSIALPPTITEQEAIAGALSDADAWIESLEQLIAKKRQIKQGAMQELLTGKRRLPGFSGKWETKRLGDLAQIKTGSRNNEDKVELGEYPFFVRSDTVERINTYSHDCEAILVPGEGRIGEIFHYMVGRFDVHQRVYAITQFVEAVSPRFLYFYMKSNFGVWAMENTVKATVDSLRLPTFTTFKVSLPSSTEEQTAIASVLFDMDTEIESLESKLSKAREIKQGMMQELLTGRIRLV